MNQNSALTIKAFGGFHIMIGKNEIEGFERTRVQELLVYLLLNRGQPIGRSQIAFLFWPESSQKQAFSNFRNLFYYLRKSLPDYNNFIAADTLTITWLQGSPVLFDVAEFVEYLSKAENSKPWLKKVDHLEKSVRFYRGELLPGIYSNWVLVERKRFAQALCSALSELVSLYEAHRQYQRAIQHARSLIQQDPLHEPAYAQLMRLHALNDNRTAALHVYHSFATILRQEMGIEPGHLLQDLYDKLLCQVKIPKSETHIDHVVPLVGREKSWKHLQRAWRSASQKPQLALILGETGIGKTRLAEAFGDWVARQGVPVLKARCYATESNLAYAPIISWLRGCPIGDLEPSVRSELSRFLPEIYEKHPHTVKPEPINEDWQRLHLFKALEHALFTGHKSLMLFLDDLQWCDPETLDWLFYALSSDHRRLAHHQLLVVVALRSNYHDANANIPTWQANLTRINRLTILELTRLNPTDTFTLASHISDHALDPKLDSSLYQITEGHPFFIVEFICAAMPLSFDYVEQMSALTTTYPDKVRYVLQAHLSQLSPQAREVIEQAAIIGRSFTYPVLSQLTQVSEDDLVSCLDECWRRQVIREQAQDAYDFSHDKLREVAYEGISLTRRRWLHRQVAKILERLHADELGRFADMIAGHYEKAGFIEQAKTYYNLASQTANEV